MEQKIQKFFFVFQIISFELGVANFLSSTGYLSSAVNVLTNTLKILRNTMGEIFQINIPDNDEKGDKSAHMEIWQVFETLSHVGCQSMF